MKERKEMTKLSLNYEDIESCLNKNSDFLERYVRSNVSLETLEKWFNEKREQNNVNLGFSERAPFLDLNEVGKEESDLIGRWRKEEMWNYKDKSISREIPREVL